MLPNPQDLSKEIIKGLIDIGITSLGYTILESGVEAADQIYDLSMATACNTF